MAVWLLCPPPLMLKENRDADPPWNVRRLSLGILEINSLYNWEALFMNH